MQIVTAAARRETTTPNATMTTLASPTLGAAGASLWLVEMHPDAAGPVHAFDSEVVWAITRGPARLEVGSTAPTSRGRPASAGDTVVLAAGEMRQFVAGPDGFAAVATTAGSGAVTRQDGQPADIVPWVA